jgi:DNA repair protein RecN (Recombination protein N)
MLVDLHGQHEHQLLLDPSRHIEFLDAFGGLVPRVGEVREACHAWRSCREELEELSSRERGKAEELDLLNFQVGEISAARLEPGEDGRLSAEKSRLAHAQRITGALAAAYDALAGEGGAQEMVGRAVSALKGVEEYDPGRIGPEAEAMAHLDSIVQSEAQDLRQLLEKLEADPARLEQVEERLDTVSRLKRKYGGSEEAVLKYLEEARTRAAELTGAEEKLAALKGRAEELRRELSAKAAALSRERERVSARFAELVGRQLVELAMSGADFGVKTFRRGDPDGPVEMDGNRYACTAEGIDSVEYYLAPNVGESTKPLKAIASGGELSRIMLALKSVLARVDRVGTLVFDEIDAGIGGGVAEVVGRKLKEIGDERQVLCITHLPQIAAHAQEHVAVRKMERDGHAQAIVMKLKKKERVEELARMLAGAEITPTALKHAETLLRGG